MQIFRGGEGPTIRWNTSRAALILFFVFILLTAAASPSSAQQAIVKVNGPERVSGAFVVFVNLDNALELDSGQFDLYFDPDAIRVVDVEDGVIGDIPVPVGPWTILEPGRIRVIFNFPGVGAISGNGHLAKINAEAIGKMGDTIGLSIQKGLLVNKMANRIPSQWINGKIKIEGVIPDTEPAAVIRPEQATGPDTESGGMAISTPVALAGLAALAVIPGLLLVLSRKRKQQ